MEMIEWEQKFGNNEPNVMNGKGPRGSSDGVLPNLNSRQQKERNRRHGWL